MTNPPTPPRPAVPEMPKANFHVGYGGLHGSRCWHLYLDNTTAIERAYTDLATQLAESQAECERLREALERIRPAIHYFDPEETGIKVNRTPRFNGLCRIIDQALTPKETADD